MQTVVAAKMPLIKSIIIGGDFNTNADQPMFASEKTLQALTEAGFTSGFEPLLLDKRVTHPGSGGYPDATFDYLFSRGAKAGEPIITESSVSDHFPVTREILIRQAD